MQKYCPGCDQTLPTTEFGVRKASKDGLAPRCRSCTNKQKREKYNNDQEEREKTLIRVREYRHSNVGRAKRRAWERNQYKTNSEYRIRKNKDKNERAKRKRAEYRASPEYAALQQARREETERRYKLKVKQGYKIWQGMKARCENPSRNEYPYYGAKGIKVCSRWRESFEAFIEDMGPRPSKKHSIDRIDSSKDYEPHNCRWATPEIQSRNRSIVKLSEDKAAMIRVMARRGVPVKNIAKTYGVTSKTIRDVIGFRTWN